jgi:peroxiredoxin
MLQVRQMIAPLTVRSRYGDRVHAWDFKHKQNLVIAFLDADCESCTRFIQQMGARVACLRDKNARALLVFAKAPREVPDGALPEEFIAGVDENGHGVEAFLGAGALVGPTLKRRGVFVTDQYGEIADLWITHEHGFPDLDEVFGALNRVEIACEECEVPFWPVEER